MAHVSGQAQVALVAAAGLVPFLSGLGADAARIMGPAGIDELSARRGVSKQGTFRS